MREIPNSLQNLHRGEEHFRRQAIELIQADELILRHLHVVEECMNLADLLREFDNDDEDFKAIKILGMRIVNAFGSSIKLALSGYAQNSALILRDVLETIFLLDYFNSNRDQISVWRFADDRTRNKQFSPFAIRIALDERDGFTEQKRKKAYKLLSELAAHPNMKSAIMMRPRKDGDATIGPFIEKALLEAVLSEMGKFAVQAGEQLLAFYPEDWTAAIPARDNFSAAKQNWIVTFYTD